MTNPTDARYYTQLDADARHEAAVEAAQSEIYEALLTTGHDDVDDESLLLNIDAGAIRAARALCNAGARDAALAAFMALTEAAADRAANDEAERIVDRRTAESKQERDADHYDAMREERMLGL